MCIRDSPYAANQVTFKLFLKQNVCGRYIFFETLLEMLQFGDLVPGKSNGTFGFTCDFFIFTKAYASLTY